MWQLPVSLLDSRRHTSAPSFRLLQSSQQRLALAQSGSHQTPWLPWKHGHRHNCQLWLMGQTAKCLKVDVSQSWNCLSSLNWRLEIAAHNPKCFLNGSKWTDYISICSVLIIGVLCLLSYIYTDWKWMKYFYSFLSLESSLCSMRQKTNQ